MQLIIKNPMLLCCVTSIFVQTTKHSSVALVLMLKTTQRANVNLTFVCISSYANEMKTCPIVPCSSINQIANMVFTLFVFIRTDFKDSRTVFTVRLHVMQRTVLLSEFCLSIRLSVCLSVICVYCDKTKQRTANIFIPHERAITLVF